MLTEGEEEDERKSVDDEDSDEGANTEDNRREMTVDSAEPPAAMETDDIGTLPTGFKVPDFNWLTSQHFGEELAPQS